MSKPGTPVEYDTIVTGALPGFYVSTTRSLWKVTGKSSSPVPSRSGGWPLRLSNCGVQPVAYSPLKREEVPATGPSSHYQQDGISQAHFIQARLLG